MSIQLVAFDKHNKLQYAGFCRLSVVKPSSMLLIEPKNEEFKLISALFKWNFVKVKNIIFVFAEHDFMNFCLAFKNETICQQLFNNIPYQTDSSPDKSIRSKFLIPIFDKIKENPGANSELIGIIAFWMTLFEDELRQVFIKFLRDHDIYNLINTANLPRNFTEISLPKTVKSNDVLPSNSAVPEPMEVSQGIDSRKQKIIEVLRKPKIELNEKASSPLNSLSAATTKTDSSDISFPRNKAYIPKSMFHLCQNKRGKKNKRIVVFASEKKDFVYSFRWYKNNTFACSKCSFLKVHVLAKLYDQHLRILRSHVCNPIKFSAEMIEPISIIRKPLFEFHENLKGEKDKRLIVFTSEKKDFYYNFYCTMGNLFACSMCSSEGRKKYVTLKVLQNKNDGIFLSSNYIRHVCVPRKYKPEMFAPKIIISQSMYELKKNSSGEKDKRLIVYASGKSGPAYSFYWEKQSETFRCGACRTKKMHVFVKVKENANGDKYFEQNIQHSCEPKMIIEKIKKHVAQSMFELCKNINGDKDKNIKLFTSETKEFYFPYYWVRRNEYKCPGCLKLKKYAVVQLFDDNANGEKYLEINGDHFCQPQKYEGKAIEPTIIPESMFELCKNTKGEEEKHLLVFTSETKNLCYKFFQSSGTRFYCISCSKMKHCVSAKLCENESGSKYLEIKTTHKCSPQQFDGSELESVTIILESMFEMRDNKIGGKDKIIIVFTSTKKDYCYQFHQQGDKNYYLCAGCNLLKTYVGAKILQSGNGKNYLELKKTQHVCELRKFNEEDYKPLMTVPQSMFEFGENTKGEKNKKIILFTSEARDFCYFYYWEKNSKKFACSSCTAKKKHVTAKLCQYENGENYLEFSKIQHVCTPKTFSKELILPKPILSPSKFQLTENKKGEKNKRLIIFTSDEKDIGYSYHWDKGQTYICSSCDCGKKLPKTYVSAKLRQHKSGENYLELNHTKHVCTPKPLKTTLPNSMFRLCKNKNGEANKKLYIFASEKKDVAYNFCWIRPHSFICSVCNNMNTYVFAKLKENENGEYYLELNPTQKHACTPKPLEPETRQSFVEYFKTVNGKDSKN